jgi:hypothetical protein
MGSAEQHDPEVHSEIENLEELRFGKRQDNYASQLGQCYATENLNTR